VSEGGLKDGEWDLGFWSHGMEVCSPGELLEGKSIFQGFKAKSCRARPERGRVVLSQWHGRQMQSQRGSGTHSSGLSWRIVGTPCIAVCND
jgi:hypothetical protein